MDRRRAVVTAGTGGIGLETAKGLAAQGFTVTVVGRDAQRGARALERIAAVATGGGPAFLAADLSSLREVRALAARLAAEGPLHILVNNVGAMFPQRQRTVDGIEAGFAVNHLSPYLLTELLLDSLRAGGPSRIVNVSSAAIRVARRTFAAVEPPGGYYGFHWYGRAKLANLVYTLDLAERLRGSGVTVFAADPGGAATDMTDGTLTSPKVVSPPLRLLWPLVRRAFERSTAGPASLAARSSVAAATAPEFAGRTGLLIGPLAVPVPAFRGSTDPRAVADVLRLSRELAPLRAE
ncbi:SDR family NAD(P)-dependent oxidoreductase [Streptomyces clavuligerus]|uniref:Short-chain dehydrogenase/reductase SDR n=1 Tax=Streptomyces clavuligerus TaxID=1901 RepID=D5SL20_STRCL|nr:SDR family NAD(P)-dependent oxidoreductase [Streptomyces clavuligerus]ANW22493.1 short-chain dehydrogenase [Streptomyces clavuligerus]AXU16999.1 SDR family NAD(P)-dependent oxidoreductase [Streptomyces clavuligerus]AXU17394.1 SDR family NAD(P)-dependent oxidoreductase [Streptomyces clavuligerus]EFG04613.1 short-chain dehydrogenase/reductase SDR [Streptomyces clavuligerus]MBY6306939.1 SDR family NAD(P)-dependent oxidoreductase [Streptomyces clavuligerus]